MKVCISIPEEMYEQIRKIQSQASKPSFSSTVVYMLENSRIEVEA